VPLFIVYAILAFDRYARYGGRAAPPMPFILPPAMPPECPRRPSSRHYIEKREFVPARHGSPSAAAVHVHHQTRRCAVDAAAKTDVFCLLCKKQKKRMREAPFDA